MTKVCQFLWPISIPKISYCHVLLLGAFFPEIARITRLLSPPSASADSTWDINPFEFESYCIVHIVSNHIISNQIVSNHIKSHQITSNHITLNLIKLHHIKSYQIVSNRIKSYQCNIKRTFIPVCVEKGLLFTNLP